MAIFGGMSFPHFIYPNGGSEGAEPPGFFLILRIKNKRFSLKSFNFSFQNSGFKMVINLLVSYLIGTL